ncbi:Uncharacterized protein HDE_12576 [Halotydeus destructor]|nr:Uncharacterized protein HDE_12576 [Halotydeus destructor]
MLVRTMSSSVSTKWVQFFTDAGLPSKFATKYAVTFNEHRIQYDMLKELNKEVLNDMGIKTMGDVIAILRHAKEVDEEENKVKVLANEARSSKQSSSSKAKDEKIASSNVKPDNRLPPKLAQRLGPAKRSVEDEVGQAILKARRTISPPRFSPDSTDRVVKVVTKPASPPNKTVFQRLGSGSKSDSSRTVLKSSDYGKATATVKPTSIRLTERPSLSMRSGPSKADITGHSVKERLGTPSAHRSVAGSNIRFKRDPSPKAKLVQLKKNIFDRLGS